MSSDGCWSNLSRFRTDRVFADRVALGVSSAGQLITYSAVLRDPFLLAPPGPAVSPVLRVAVVENHDGKARESEAQLRTPVNNFEK